mmetsp:Transcript_20002/g.58433  ORF Transcript_20002/g.58433 Transcript_20002/m.58433 type:complete len:211 (+) Transcript_20002:2618-3250(+)
MAASLGRMMSDAASDGTRGPVTTIGRNTQSAPGRPRNASLRMTRCGTPGTSMWKSQLADVTFTLSPCATRTPDGLHGRGRTGSGAATRSSRHRRSTAGHSDPVVPGMILCRSGAPMSAVAHPPLGAATGTATQDKRPQRAGPPLATAPGPVDAKRGAGTRKSGPTVTTAPGITMTTIDGDPNPNPPRGTAPNHDNTSKTGAPMNQVQSAW